METMQSFSREIEGIEPLTAERMAEDLLADLRDAAESGQDDAAIYFGSTEYPEFVYRIYYERDLNGRLRLWHRLCSGNSLGVNPREREDHDRAIEELSKPRFSRIEFSGFEFTGQAKGRSRGYQDAPAREPSGD